MYSLTTTQLCAIKTTEALISTLSIGIIIGSLTGAMFFVVFGMKRAVHAGGFATIIILNKVQGRPVEQTFFVRILVAAGIFVSSVLGIGVAMIGGGIVGGLIGDALRNMARN